ncbi:hypothetical protein M758_10G125900 [Ceratodon purpureus]|nr:hypothetical protein M758_10G125900 [Ceratodon purpureus]
MECTRGSRLSAKQTFEIHVCVSRPVTGIAASERKKRLRFVLLGSPWFLKPFGMLLWSLLHLLLVVAEVSLLVVNAVYVLAVVLTELALWLSIDIIRMTICAICVCCLLLCGLVLLIWSLMRLSWSLIFEGERSHQIRVACRSFVEWWDFNSDLPSESIRLYLMMMLGGLWLHSTCKCVKEYCQEISDDENPWSFVITLGRWCEEVVHMHDTICI